MTTARILLVDDDESLLKLLSMRLKASHYHVETATSGLAALAKLNACRPHVVVTDYKMQGMDGLQLFAEIQKDFPSIPVIMLTAHGSIPGAVEATRKGIYGYLAKPFESKALLQEINSALDHGTNRMVSAEWRQDILSQSHLIEELLQQCFRIAQSDASVLIQGESGTGKELFAKAIHLASARKSAPFVPINCAAIPHNLLESELFGHRKGAFTGASSNHLGLFKAAEGGTLLLDEIGDMPLEFQAKLLRALEERKIRAVGSSESTPIDIRLISASHVDLENAVTDKRFREDLYYRLNVVMLTIPPLSERREDIPLLARHFLEKIRRNNPHCCARTFSPEALNLLLKANWPGNIRQLLNVVEQVVVFSNTPVISEDTVLRALKSGDDEILSLEAANQKFERDYLVRLLQTTQGNVTHAAKIAKRNRTEFYKLLKRHHLDAASFRT